MLLHRNKTQERIESTARFRSASPVSEGIFRTAFRRVKLFGIKVITATFLFASVISPYSCSNVSAASPPAAKKVEIKDSDAQSNVTVYEKGVWCGPDTRQFKGYMSDESVEYLKQMVKESQEKESNFKNSNVEYGVPVTLKELNDGIKKIVEIVAGEMGSQALERGIEALMKKGILEAAIGGALKEALIALTPLDLCAGNSELGWGAYYKSLGYKDADKFQIWVWSGFGENKIFDEIKKHPETTDATKFEIKKYEIVRDLFAVFVKNPSVTVLPVQVTRPWKPPYAVIQGTVSVDGKTIYTPREINVTQIDKSLPMRFDINDPLHLTKPKGQFKFFVRACETCSPTYDVTLTGPPEFNLPKATVKDAKDGRTYTINFRVKEGCKKYSERTTGDETEVSCEDGVSALKRGKYACSMTDMYMPPDVPPMVRKMVLDSFKRQGKGTTEFSTCDFKDGYDKVEGGGRTKMSKTGENTYSASTTAKEGMDTITVEVDFTVKSDGGLTLIRTVKTSNAGARRFGTDKEQVTFDCKFAKPCK